MNEKTPEPKQFLALVIIAVISAIGALVLALVAGSIDTHAYGVGGEDPSKVAVQAGLSQWSNYLMLITAVAVIGAIVLSGVQTLLMRRV